MQLPELLSGEGGQEYQPSPFFSEQLTAFELWLEHGSPDKRPPEQLPIVLQVRPRWAAGRAWPALMRGRGPLWGPELGVPLLMLRLPVAGTGPSLCLWLRLEG